MSRNLRDWLRQLNVRQQKRTLKVSYSAEDHICDCCGTSFCGNFCPQCGKKATFTRMNLKNAFTECLNFLGYDTRSVPYTAKELFWRPGYMMRDYLNGYSQFYYSPFNMLVITTLFFVVACWLRGLHVDTEPQFLYGDFFVRYNAPEWMVTLFAKVDDVLRWLHQSPAWSAILFGIFYIIASYLVFRKRMNFVEIFISQVFIFSQMQIIGTVYALLTGSEVYYNMPPFAVPIPLGIAFLCYDYMQLFQLGFWASLWRTILSFVVGYLLILLFMATPMLIVKYTELL